MSNMENLKNGKATQFKSGKQAKEAGSKGGKASAKSKRAKKELKTALSLLLESEISDKKIAANTAKMFNISTDELTWLDACVAALVSEAINGNVKAIHAIREIMDNKTPDNSGVQIIIAPRGE